jgi:hypothetical protein
MSSDWENNIFWIDFDQRIWHSPFLFPQIRNFMRGQVHPSRWRCLQHGAPALGFLKSSMIYFFFWVDLEISVKIYIKRTVVKENQFKPPLNSSLSLSEVIDWICWFFIFWQLELLHIFLNLSTGVIIIGFIKVKLL